MRPIYGRSTGVGANRTAEWPSTTRANPCDSCVHTRLSAGGDRDPRRVRALLVVRLNQLANGGSGISPAVFDGLAG